MEDRRPRHRQLPVHERALRPSAAQVAEKLSQVFGDDDEKIFPPMPSNLGEKPESTKDGPPAGPGLRPGEAIHGGHRVRLGAEDVLVPRGKALPQPVTTV